MDALNPQSELRPEADREPGLSRHARRNLLLLACCQAVGQSCNTMMFAATGLSVITFYRHPEFANLPVTMQHIGVMFWVFPAALLMQRVGRSIGFRDCHIPSAGSKTSSESVRGSLNEPPE